MTNNVELEINLFEELSDADLMAVVGGVETRIEFDEMGQEIVLNVDTGEYITVNGRPV